jgi:hypothetical protein
MTPNARVTVPLLAGEARVRITPGPQQIFNFPEFQALSELRHVTPGWQETQTNFTDWLPVGDDILTLLDACAQNIPISVDVHNLRGLQIDDPTFSNFQDPVMYSSFVNSLNISRTCGIGFPSTRNPIDPHVVFGPQNVLFNASLTCPPLLVWIGQLRANSSYYNLTSNIRLSFNEVRELLKNVVDQGEQQQILRNRIAQGDLNDRIDVLSELMIAKGGISFNVNATAHYETCKPATCSYTDIEPPSVQRLVQISLANYGGTATSIITVFGSLTLYSSFFMYQYKLWRARRREADELRSAGKMAGVLVTNPAVLK